MKPETKKHFLNILDTFSGTDGGVSFVKLKTALEEWDKAEDPAGKELLKMMINFSKIILVLDESKRHML